MTVPGASGRWPSISVIIPALNESRNLLGVFSRLPIDLHEVILVDGHSVDETLATARRLRPDVRLITQNRRGKGNALACGFAAATGQIIVMLDADGSTDPAEIPRFIDSLIQGADFAKGSRFADGGGSSDITRLRRVGNRALSMLVNAIFGTDYSDLCYGYNAIWRKHLGVLRLDAESPAPAEPDDRRWGDGFEVEALINIRVAAAGLIVAEVPSFEHARVHGVSNLNAFSDGMRVLLTIAKEWRYRWGRRAVRDTGTSRDEALSGLGAESNARLFATVGYPAMTADSQAQQPAMRSSSTAIDRRQRWQSHSEQSLRRR